MIDVPHNLEYYKWYSIEHYPRDELDWGPDAIFEINACEEYPFFAVRYYGHLEAGMWYVRDCDDPYGWAEIFKIPDSFMLIEHVKRVPYAQAGK